MDETENPESQLSSPGAGRDTGAEGKVARRERSTSGSRVGAVGRLGQFVRDVRAELKRVSWPGPKEVKNTTIITLVAVVFFATYLFLVDLALAKAIGCDGSTGCGGHASGLHWLISKVFG